LPRKGDVAHLLDAVLAEPEGRVQVERVAVRRQILLARRRTDIAEQVADRLPVRVVAREAAHRLHAVVIRQAHVDRGEIVPADAGRDLDGKIFGLRRRRLADAGDLLGRQAQQAREVGERLFEVGDLLGDQLQPVIGLVDGERLAVPVDDPAAPGRDQAHRDAVVLGEKLVLLLLEDRQVRHAPGEH